MTRQDAKLLMAQLAAAFPFPQLPVATVALYVEKLEPLLDVDAARAAVDEAVDTLDRLPSVAWLLQRYRDHARRNAERRANERGLDEPPPDPANAARARELLDRLRTRGWEDAA